MCGIFAYLNYRVPKYRFEISRIVIEGLYKLEYRGYDSAGIALDGSNQEIVIFKQVGPVKKLEQLVQNELVDLSSLLDFHVAIGHTRWATHGAIEARNCHPQASSEENEFVLVHNGIVTNYKEIKNMLLQKGHKFVSVTDTEVIAILFLHCYNETLALGEKPKFQELTLRVTSAIQGASAIVVKSKLFPGELCAFKRGSPLVFGIKSEDTYDEEYEVSFAPEHGIRNILHSSAQSISSNNACEYILSSDVNSIVEHTRNMIYMEDNDVVHFDSKGLFEFLSMETRQKSLSQLTRKQLILDQEMFSVSKGKFEHFMLKEIYEQGEAIRSTMRGRINFNTGVVTLGGLASHINSINRCRRLVLIACGTSYHSTVAIRMLLEELTALPVSVEVASDFMDRSTPIFRDDTCFFISQSGETSDTIEALKYCKKYNALCVGITNTVGSHISRLTDCGIYLNAGPEIGVASTKCYTSQIIALCLIAVKLSQDRISSQGRRCEIIQELGNLPDLIRDTLLLAPQMEKVARKLAKFKTLLLLGRGYEFATCLEGALKIKEIAYIYSEGLNMGELKHGPLALIEPTTPLIMILTKDRLYQKSFSALQQVLCRRGHPIVICTKGDEDIKGLVDDVIEVPHVIDCLQPIINIIPLQLLSYYMAKMNGINVDRPRNLAKAVTVE